jgi:nitrite reductase/ring-hydroxylating ferredoxin subunit
MSDTAAGQTQIELCSADEVAPGTALKVETHGLELAVFNVDGTFYVTDECNFHQGQFNIRTGAVVLPPCLVPVKTYPTFVRDGKVCIAL